MSHSEFAEAASKVTLAMVRHALIASGPLAKDDPKTTRLGCALRLAFDAYSTSIRSDRAATQLCDLAMAVATVAKDVEDEGSCASAGKPAPYDAGILLALSHLFRRISASSDTVAAMMALGAFSVTMVRLLDTLAGSGMPNVYIGDLDKALVLLTLWQKASPRKEFQSAAAALSMTEASARTWLATTPALHFTLLLGRPLYVDLSGDYVDTRAFDAWHGDGAARQAIRGLRETFGRPEPVNVEPFRREDETARRVRP